MTDLQKLCDEIEALRDEDVIITNGWGGTIIHDLPMFTLDDLKALVRAYRELKEGVVEIRTPTGLPRWKPGMYPK